MDCEEAEGASGNPQSLIVRTWACKSMLCKHWGHTCYVMGDDIEANRDKPRHHYSISGGNIRRWSCGKNDSTALQPSPEIIAPIVVDNMTRKHRSEAIRERSSSTKNP